MAAPSGTTWGSIAGGYGRVGIYVGITNTNTQTTVTISTWFWSKYSVTDSSNNYYYNNNATSATSKVGSINIKTTVASGEGWSTSNQFKLGESSYTYDRGTSAVTRNCAVKLTDVDRVGATMTHTRSYTIPALASYTVSYNANGGSGAPSAQTKWYGKTLALSTTRPTRTGYSFQGWGTSASDTSVDYAAGANYTANAAVTLYAIWKANTYTVSYNANGGSGAPSSQTKTYGVTLKLSSTVPTRTNYNFLGWGTSASATKATYAAGANYTSNQAATLYAVWELAYTKPRISNLAATREDTRARVSFKWACDLDVQEIKIELYLAAQLHSEWLVTPIDLRSGVVSSIGAEGTLSTDNTYAVRVTVTDAGGSTTSNTMLPSAKFLIDLIGDEGIAFGKAAELGAADSLGGTGVADFGFDAKFNKPVYGKALGMDKLPSIPLNSDFNDYKDPGCYAVRSNANAQTCANMPIYEAGRLEVWSSTGQGVSPESYSYLRQRFVPYASDHAVWERDIHRGPDNIWRYSSWWQSSLTPAVSKNVYHEQKCLWGGDLTGGMYMTAGHTITLTEKISEQPHGIILVFSAYESASDTNYGWQCFFVPKLLVALSTSGHTFELSRGKHTRKGTKYLYIYDDRIVGHDDNSLTGTNNGITFANNKFVLRYVIGI